MTAAGTPTWTMINGLPALTALDNVSGAASANVANIVDITGNFYFETMFTSPRRLNYPVTQNSGTGGFILGQPTGVTTRLDLYLYTAAGAGARLISVNMLYPYQNKWHHIVLASLAGGTSGVAWVNGIPTAVALALAGVAANTAPAQVTVCKTRPAQVTLARVWQGIPTNEDAQALYGCAHDMFGV